MVIIRFILLMDHASETKIVNNQIRGATYSGNFWEL